MIKIAQPVRYGSELKDIEFAQFPELSDTVKTVLDFSVGITQPAKDEAVAKGKFTRCDISGNLLQSKHPRFENIQLMEYEFPPDDTFHDFVFSQKVYRVYIDVYDSFQFTALIHTDLLHAVILRAFIAGSKAIILFVGRTICFHSSLGPAGYCKIRLYGFY